MLNGVTLKRPKSGDVDLQLTRIEAEFRASGMRQDTTKYDSVIRELLSETSMEILSLIISQYDAIKTFIKGHALSERRRYPIELKSRS